MAKTYNISATINPGRRHEWYENGRDYSSAASLIGDNKRNWVGKFNGDSRAVNLKFDFTSFPSGAVITSIKLNVTIGSGSVGDNANYQIQYKKTSSASDWEGTGTVVGYVKVAGDNAISSTTLPSNGLTIVPRTSSLNAAIEITAAKLVVTTQTYTVSYNANGGGNAPDSQTKNSGEPLTLTSSKPTAPAATHPTSYTVTCKPNYTGASDQALSATRTTSYWFSKWNTAANGGGVDYASGGTYNANASATLYAQWGGTTTTASVTLPTLSRTGHTFNGWYDAASGGNKIGNGGASYTPTGNKTLYAHWTAATYTVSYNANGGTNAPASQTKTYGQDLTLRSDTPTRSDATTNYTVTFNANDGNVSPSSRTATRTTTYQFSKWNTASDGSGTNYNSSGTYSANAAATLYAQWWTSSTSTTAITLPTPTRTGYTFSGWYTAASGGTKIGNAGASYTPTATIPLYAQWAVITYTITYNKGTYGTGTNTSATKTYGVELPLKGAIFTRTGYEQRGWSTDTYGTSKAYELSASYTANSGKTLYPYWVANTYSVTYNANGGSGAPNAQTKTYGVSLPLRTGVPTRSGYNFLGWATSSTGAVAYQPGDSYTTNAAVTLYAVWAAATSTVSAPNGTLGTALTISITRNSSSYTHDLTYAYGSQTGSIANGVGTSFSWTPPTSMASAFPNATSGTCTITCTTKSGSVVVGTSTTTCSLSIPSSIKPTINSFSATPHSSNSTVDGWNVAVRGYSYMGLAVSTSMQGGATRSSITYTGPGIDSTGNSTSANTAVLDSAGSKTWTVTVKDSRGRATSQTETKTVYDYAPPVISKIETYRCESDGTINNGSGTYAKFKPVFTYSPVTVSGTNKNSVQSAKLKWRVVGGSWSSEINVTSGTFTAVLGGGNIDITKAYEVSVTVTDKLTSSTFTTTLPSASGLWYGRGNDRLGLGGVPPSAGLHCDWDATFNGVFDVTPRRCYANLSSAGWYRVLTVTDQGLAGSGVIAWTVDLNITRTYNGADNEVHSIKLLGVDASFSFADEVSKSNVIGIDKIRYMRNGNVGYVDIHYSLTRNNGVSVDFDVHTRYDAQSAFTANSLAGVGTSPSGETEEALYTFAANTEADGTFSPESGITISEADIKRSGRVVYVHFYASGSFSANTANRLGTLTGVPLPSKNVRWLASGGAAAFNAAVPVYAILSVDAGGVIQIFSESAISVVNITLSYIV